MTHRLLISSLRDLHAFCTCGKWSVILPVSDTKSDKDIRNYAKEQHKLHVESETEKEDPR